MLIKLESLESEEWPLVNRKLGASLLNVVDIKWLKSRRALRLSPLEQVLRWLSFIPNTLFRMMCDLAS